TRRHCEITGQVLPKSRMAWLVCHPAFAGVRECRHLDYSSPAGAKGLTSVAGPSSVSTAAPSVPRPEPTGAESVTTSLPDRRTTRPSVRAAAPRPEPTGAEPVCFLTTSSQLSTLPSGAGTTTAPPVTSSCCFWVIL